MTKNVLKSYLRKRTLLEIKINELKKDLNEQQMEAFVHDLARKSDLLSEGFFSSVASMLGFNRPGEVKRFLAGRVVSHLGVPRNHPLYAPLTNFINKLSVREITALYNGNPRMRKKLVKVLTDATVSAFIREMPAIMNLTGGGLGDPVTDAMIDAVSAESFKASVKRSLEDSLAALPDSSAADMEAMKQDFEQRFADIEKGIDDISQSLKNKMKSDPTDADTDDDGLPDGVEADLNTDPRDPDTDDDGATDGEEVGSIKGKMKEPDMEQPETAADDTASDENVEKAEQAAEKAEDAAEAAEEAEESGDQEEAEKASEEAQEAAQEAEEAAEEVQEEPDASEAEEAAEQAKIKARKAEASKLRIPMRDFIKAKLNLDNDLGRYDPRISLEDLQAIHDNFVAAETDQQRLAAIETFARAKTFEELTKLIGAPDTEAPTPEPEADIEEPAEEPAVEEPAEETPEPEVGEESIPSDVLEKYRRLYDLYNEPGNTYNKTLKLSKQIEDLEIKYPELADLDLDSDAEDEPEVEDLPEPEIEEPEAEKEPARMIRPTETPRVRDGEGKDVEIPEYELSLDPKSEKSKKALLDTIEKLQPEGDMDLYQRNLNKYLDRQVDRFYEEAQEKAPKAKSVKDKKKTEKQYTEEYVAKQTAKMLDVIQDKVSDKGSTEGFSYIFGRAVPTKSEPETVEKKISYRQVDVVLDDDKTTVMSSRPPEKSKINRPKLGESILEEGRKEIFSVDLPPIPVEDIPKVVWTQSTDEERSALARKVLELLKAKQEEDPESVEVFDLGQDEETGTPNLVIMKTTLNLDNTVSGGVIDQRKVGVIEIPEGALKNTYSMLARKYITKVEDKKAGIVPGMFNANKAVMDYQPEQAGGLRAKRLKELADYLKIDTSDFEYSMPFIIQYILEKTGDLVTGAPQLGDEPKEKPTSKAPEMSPEEEEAMEPSAADLAAIEKEEEEDVEGLEEALEISEDLLRRLLA